MTTRTESTKKAARVKLNVNREFILIDNNLVQIDNISTERKVSSNILATIVANLVYYGFTLSKEAFDTLATLDEQAVKEWWIRFEPAIYEYTCYNKNMD